MDKEADFNSLANVLTDSAKCEKGITFIESEKDEDFLSYRELYKKAAYTLDNLQKIGVKPGDELVFQFQYNKHFIITFWACILGKIIPVPLSFGISEEVILKLANVWKLLNHPFLITDLPGYKEMIGSSGQPGNDMDMIPRIQERTIYFDDVHVIYKKAETISSGPDDIAFIQYSSGSTGTPKGVINTHKSLIYNIRRSSEFLKMTEKERILSWMPLTHDMGLIFFHILPLFNKAHQYIMPPIVFLTFPHLWMSKASDHQITISGSPNFGYRYYLDHFDEKTMHNRSLERIKFLINGAEPISFNICEQFLQQLSTYRLSRKAMSPSYGLAEATLAVSSLPLEEEFSEYLVHREYLNVGDTVKFVEPQSENAASFVDCGVFTLGTSVMVTDEKGNPLPEETIGYIKIKGPSVTRGYYNDEATTNKTINRDGWLETGDLGFIYRQRLVIVGRGKEIIIINGQNYYPGDLERTAESLPGLKHGNIAAASIYNHQAQKEEILCFVVFKQEMKEFVSLAARLKLHFIDKMGIEVQQIIPIDKIPVTTSGKIQRYKLKERYLNKEFQPVIEELASLRRQMNPIKKDLPKHEVQEIVVQICKEVLKLEEINIHDNFFDLGGNSSYALRVRAKLEAALDKELDDIALFKYPTIAAMVDYLTSPGSDQTLIDAQKERLEAFKNNRSRSWERIKTNLIKEPEKNKGRNGLEIAVIGMSGRFPGAKTLHEFWENLKNGIDSISFFSHEELNESGVNSQLLDDPNYVKAKGVLEDSSCFDSGFFGYTPMEARQLDPQVRIFHECLWEALEDGGYEPGTYPGLIGLYAGASPNTFWSSQSLLSGRISARDQFTDIQANKDFMSTRASYTLNLRGPSFTMYTACSTSLVAVDLACQGLLSGKCEMALAGGVSIWLPEKNGYLYEESMLFSRDGHNRTFDEQASGTIFSDGAGMVLLKRLEDAITSGDHIYAVIKGSAINNDGDRKIGYTAPGVEGQAEVIASALDMADVEPETICYLEAHGTATTLGDTIEMEALNLVFQTPGAKRNNYCAIGSVKSNIGHLNAAAGIAGLIKTILVLNHRLIPPTPHFQASNPGIDFANSPFYVNTRLNPLKSNSHPLRTGVSSFGIGGTNAHVILEEAPKTSESMGQPYQLILLSARTANALDKMTENLARHLKENPAINLADMAYTLQVGRKVFKHRRMLVTPDAARTIQVLSGNAGKAYNAVTEEKNPPVIFMFAGVGSQYVNMGRDLYQDVPLFREEMNRCFEILKPIIGYDLKEILYPPSVTSVPLSDNSLSFGQELLRCQKEIKVSPGEQFSEPKDGPTGPSWAAGAARVAKKINEAEIIQPLIFILEYALAKLLIKWGIKPEAMIGYSFGEYVAACIAGVFSLEEGLKLVVSRARLIQQTPEGAMLSVPLPIEELQLLLEEHDRVSIAIDNGPSTIVAGTPEAIDAFAKKMKGHKYMCMRVDNTRALHAKEMEPIAASFENQVAQINLEEPQIPFMSNVTGKEIHGNDVTHPDYWSKHLKQTVQFATGLKQLAQKPDALFIEIGPGRDLSALVRRYLEDNPDQRVINLLRNPHQDFSDTAYLLERIGRLWLKGISIDWEGFHAPDRRKRIPLPTYPFEKKQYRLEKNPFTSLISQQDRSTGKKANISEWFYVPLWKQLPPLTAKSQPADNLESSRQGWLVLADSHGIGARLAERLQQQDQDVLVVKAGTGFHQDKDNIYTLDPRSKSDYERLIADLHKSGDMPRRIIHLWSLNRKNKDKEEGLTAGSVEKAQDHGFYSLLYLVGAIPEVNVSQPLHLAVITNNMQAVCSEDYLCPEQATVLGAVNVIPQENPSIHCRSIDILLPEARGQWQETQLIDQLLTELQNQSPDHIMALRDKQRWVRTYEPFPLETAANKKENQNTGLRQEGVYLLTGGLGGIGLELSQYLAQDMKARLVLIGASPFPSREQWNQWLTTHPQTDKTSSRIRKIHEIEELGGKVMVLNANVADEKQLAAAVAHAETTFGPINGVIHAAGITAEEFFSPVKTMKKQQGEIHFKPKIQGLLNLQKVFQKKKPDFLMVMSSISAVLGGLAFAAYSAANIFMDSLIQQHNRENEQPWLTVNWDSWLLQGKNQQPNNFGNSMVEFSMNAREGIEVFKRILTQDNGGQFIVSVGNLQNRINQWIKLMGVEKEGDTESKTKQEFHSREDLSSPYTAPRTTIETIMAEIWRDFFGFEEVGIHDDFFELGGDSLKLITLLAKMQGKLKVEIPMPEFYKRPTIAKIAEYINAPEVKTYSPLQPVEAKEYYPLSSMQKRMYSLNQMEQEGLAYNNPAVMSVTGIPDRNRITNAFKKLIERHESLRTSFMMVEDEPVQKIHENVEFAIEYYSSGRQGDRETGNLLKNSEGSESVSDKSSSLPISPFACSSELSKKTPLSLSPSLPELSQRFTRPFDLSQAPLMRVGLLELGEEKHMLLTDFHHIIADGVSFAIIMQDFIALYEGKELPPLKLQYKDFSQWQKKNVQSQAIKKQEEYWLQEFKEEIPRLELLTDYPRPVMQSYQGTTIPFTISIKETTGLKELASRENATLFMVVLAVYNVLFSRLTGREEIVLGTVAAGRKYHELEQVIGMCLNTLALKNNPHPDMTFAAFLQEIKEKTLDAFANQDYPFEHLVDNLKIKREGNRNPLFDVMLVLQNIDFPELRTPGLKMERNKDENIIRAAKFDMTIDVSEEHHSLRITIEYSTELFKRDTMERFITYSQNLIASILQNPGSKISDLEIISEAEKKQVLYDFNDTKVAYPGDKTIQQLFARQVEKTPDHIALVGIHETHEKHEKNHSMSNMSHMSYMSYKKLNKKSQQLAQQLKEKGVGPDTIVGLMVERSFEMITGIFAILKAGGAYLPIAPNYPQDRINYILKDSNAKILLTSQEISVLSSPEAFSIRPKGASFHLHLSPAPVTSLAYIIYTSGSTGKPKGVMIQHYSVVNRLNWMQHFYPIGYEDVILQKTPYTFDVSVWELFWWSFRGASLCLLGPGQEKSPEAIIAAVEKNNVTTMHFVPSMLSAFLEYLESSLNPHLNQLASLKQVFSSGEALAIHQVETFNKLLNKHNNTKLINLYGPTEATVDVSYFNCSSEEKQESKSIPIGKPIDNIQLFVLDKHLHLQPVGIPGELCICGDGLARGYLNRPELTAEKFFSFYRSYMSYKTYISKKIYKTGDLARWLPDGDIEFLGRLDHQVKIRGFRIEPGEIEYQLVNYPGINEAVVITKEDQNSGAYIAAYVVPAQPDNPGTSPDISQLRNYLSEVLPEYMVPPYIVPLAELPLTPNGKINRKALPDPREFFQVNQNQFIAPTNQMEKILVKTWASVLGHHNIGVKDNFFMIGGDSVKAIQIVSRLAKQGYKTTMKDIFHYPTISALAPKIKKLKRTADQATVKGIIPLTPIQENFFSSSQIDAHHYNQAVMLYSKEQLLEEGLQAVLQKIQEHHDALRMTFTKEKGKVIQTNLPLEYPLSFQVFDLRNEKNEKEILETRANEIQAGINLEKGPLMKVGLFRLKDGDRLLIIIHHLVIDTVSWRILLEDIRDLYQQYQEGKSLTLPGKSDSFKLWAEKLCQYANSELLLKEKSFWAEQERLEVPAIETIDTRENNYIKDTYKMSFQLDKEETARLLSEVNIPFGTNVEEILLTALAVASRKTFGNNRLVLALEGHGREEIFADVDVNRTVGWFTTLYPVLLDASYEDNTGRQIKEIKESLRRIPNKGFGYGILKYLTDDTLKKDLQFRHTPQILFNYLGQFDSVFQKTPFAIANESTGYTRSNRNRAEYLLEIDSLIAKENLEVSITYNNKKLKNTTIEQLLNHFREALLNIIAYCSSRKKQDYTPSDFSYKELSIDQVDRLTAKYPIEDICLLTPTQEGMLFHAIYESSTAYFVQLSLRLKGKLQAALVKKSLEQLFKRYDILRTTFYYEGLERPVQLIWQEREARFSYEDLRHLDSQNQKEKFIREFKTNDRKHLFDLTRDILMRVAMMQLDENTFELVWSYHHILMDGWCLSIIFSEFLEIYSSYLENKQPQLSAVKPYREYIRWLENQDKEKTRHYWKNYLHNYNNPVGIPKKKTGVTEKNQYNQEEFSFTLSAQKTGALDQLAAANKVTLSVIFQAVWGLLLAKYNSQQDVVFGIVTSGRPGQIEDVETMAGLFINTIPVRIYLDDQIKFPHLLQQVQKTAVQSEPHQYYPLANIQAQSPLKQKLMDHFLTFLNYPIGDLIKEGVNRKYKDKGKFPLEISNLQSLERSNYDMDILINFSREIAIKLRYNSNVYDGNFMKRLASHIEEVLDQVIENNDIEIKEITISHDRVDAAFNIPLDDDSDFAL